MTRHGRVWLEMWPVWAPPLALLVMALVLLAVYQTRFAGRVEGLERQAEVRRSEIRTAQEQRLQLESMQEWRRTGESESLRLLEERLGPRSERLTAVLRHVNELGERAQIHPSQTRYATEVDADEGLERVSWSYSVLGSYGQVRRFLHLLETSDDFLILEDVRLSQVEQQGGQLRIQMGLATVFTLSESEVTVADRPGGRR